MIYRLTLPADFFSDKLNTKLLQGIVRDLRPMGIMLQFDLPGLQLTMTKVTNDFTVEEFNSKIDELKDLFAKHCEDNN